jgi:ISXO2-like transposase domain
MTTPLFDFLTKLQPAEIIPFLQEKELIQRSMACLCGNEMAIQKYNRCLDGFIFRCARCKRTKSIKDGRFFKNTSISISKIMQLIFLWITETPVSSASTLIAVSNKTAIQWFNYCRDICSYKMANMDQMLGGQGVTVQIDESLMFKRKSNTGRVIRQFWIFGIYDLNLRRGYLMHVPDRTASTLIPIIQRWVLPNTTIHSDGWRAYNGMAFLLWVLIMAKSTIL